MLAQIGANIQQKKLFGIWQNSQFGYQMVLILNENYSGEFDGEAIRFATKGDKLEITQSGTTTSYTYSLQGNALSLSGGDLEGTVAFTKQGSEPQTTNVAQQKTAIPKSSASSADLIGLWSGNGETIEFDKSGQCKYQGQTYPYQASQGHVTLNTSQGQLMMAYSVANDQLTLIVNSKQLIYSKGGSHGANNAVSNSGKGGVASELVGKWCYVNVYSTNSGGSSSSNCFVLNADGTYEYSGESSRSVNTPDFYGGTSSQSSDRGTWWVQGDQLFYNSQTKGQGSYQFQKKNHPKNNDPMIVINGQAYVTFYNKPPW
jgi:hypothetical protein